MKCFRCGAEISMFWWRICLGCDKDGNHGHPCVMCDYCWYSFLKWKQEGKE